MKLQSFYSFVFLALFSLTCISCSHGGVRTADADLSDEAVAENTESEETNQAVALMSETPSEELEAENDSSNEEPEPVFALNENSDGGSASNETVTNEESASQSEAGSGVYSSSIEQSQSYNEPVAAPKHRSRKEKSKNWQKVERKPTAKLAAPVEEERIVNREIESAIAREVLPQLVESAPLELKEEPKPELASVEISSFTQRHSWLVAFAAAGLILFLFFALTRNRAKKDMSL